MVLALAVAWVICLVVVILCVFGWLFAIRWDSSPGPPALVPDVVLARH